jgi:hypothetical protein
MVVHLDGNQKVRIRVPVRSENLCPTFYVKMYINYLLHYKASFTIIKLNCLYIKKISIQKRGSNKGKLRRFLLGFLHMLVQEPLGYGHMERRHILPPGLEFRPFVPQRPFVLTTICSETTWTLRSQA